MADNLDTELQLVVVNPVDVKKPGVYTITYNASDASGNAAVEVTRKVTVVDTTIPVITLLGEAEVSRSSSSGVSRFIDTPATADRAVTAGDLRPLVLALVLFSPLPAMAGEVTVSEAFVPLAPPGAMTSVSGSSV